MHIKFLLAALLTTTTGRYPRTLTSVVDTDLWVLLCCAIFLGRCKEL